MNKTSILLFFFILIISCNKKKDIQPIDEEVLDKEALSAETYMPSDIKLAEKYKRSCFMCHSNSDAGAPLTMAEGMWAERIEQRGLDGLLKNTLEGYNAMPMKGQCMDCTEEELMDLIKFMANVK